MKTKLNWLLIALALLLTINCQLSTARAQGVLISDFNTLNPLIGANPHASFIQSFTNGSDIGQQIAPSIDGTPTSIECYSATFPNLDISGETTLEIEARLLPGNQAASFDVSLDDADNPNDEYSWAFGTDGLNTVSFTILDVLLSSHSGSTLDYTAINQLIINGNTSNPFEIQFEYVEAVPEPGVTALFAAGGIILLLAARHGRQSRGEMISSG